jgi:hypothetical protein
MRHAVNLGFGIRHNHLLLRGKPKRLSLIVPDGRADAAEKAGGLHKLWHCTGTREAARCEYGINLAIFFAAIIGIIVFIAVSQVLLDSQE